MADITRIYFDMPVVTRTYLTGCILTTLLCQMEFITPYTIYFNVHLIFKQMQFLSDNKLRSGIFKVEFYKRLIRPFNLIAMILLAMLFIFGSTRDTSLGRKIFFGVAISLTFEMLSRLGGAISLSLNFNPLLSVVLPTVLVMMIGITLIFKKSIS